MLSTNVSTSSKQASCTSFAFACPNKLFSFVLVPFRLGQVMQGDLHRKIWRKETRRKDPQSLSLHISQPHHRPDWLIVTDPLISSRSRSSTHKFTGLIATVKMAGYAQPTNPERRLLRRVLHRSLDSLFPECHPFHTVDLSSQGTDQRKLWKDYVLKRFPGEFATATESPKGRCRQVLLSSNAVVFALSKQKGRNLSGDQRSNALNMLREIGLKKRRPPVIPSLATQLFDPNEKYMLVPLTTDHSPPTGPVATAQERLDSVHQHT